MHGVLNDENGEALSKIEGGRKPGPNVHGQQTTRADYTATNLQPGRYVRVKGPPSLPPVGSRRIFPGFARPDSTRTAPGFAEGGKNHCVSGGPTGSSVAVRNKRNTGGAACRSSVFSDFSQHVHESIFSRARYGTARLVGRFHSERDGRVLRQSALRMRRSFISSCRAG